VVVLRQPGVEHYLPIWVGPYEAESIEVALKEVEMGRPLTHELLKNTIVLFQAKVVRAEILALKEDVFYGNLVLERAGEILNIDSRPSDAIAMAVRFHAPILVSQSVLDAAGIVPEKNLQEEPPAETPTPTATGPAESAADEGRLDVFEDFLKKLGGESDEGKPSA
jgi:hypothetical protein